MSDQSNSSNVTFAKEVRFGLSAIACCLGMLVVVLSIRLAGGNFDWLTGKKRHSEYHQQDLFAELEPSENELSTAITQDSNLQNSTEQAVLDTQSALESKSAFASHGDQRMTPNQAKAQPNQPKKLLSGGDFKPLAKGNQPDSPVIHPKIDAAETQLPITSKNPPTGIYPIRRASHENELKQNSHHRLDAGSSDHLEPPAQSDSNRRLPDLKKSEDWLGDSDKESDHQDRKPAISNQRRNSIDPKSAIGTREFPVGQSIIAGKHDSFWKIAQRVYDDARFFRALYLENQDRVQSPDSIDPGTEIVTPSKLALVEKWPVSCSGVLLNQTDLGSVEQSVDYRIYVTKKGDTMFEIARDYLGQAFRFSELIQSNGSRLPKNVNSASRLPAGVLIQIPLEN